MSAQPIRTVAGSLTALPKEFRGLRAFFAGGRRIVQYLERVEELFHLRQGESEGFHAPDHQQPFHIRGGVEAEPPAERAEGITNPTSS